jgi:hypothetical protein
MIRLLWALSAHARYYLRRYMPTNIALDAIRTRRGLKRGIPGMLLAIPYFLAANYCITLIEEGGPGWLNLLVLLFCWNALKFLIMGPVSVVLLVRARVQEAVARHRTSGLPKTTSPTSVAVSRVLVARDQCVSFLDPGVLPGIMVSDMDH